MSTAYGTPCEKCGKAPLLRFTTDGNGHHREEVLQACPCARKQMRLCRDCPASIAEMGSRFILCPSCRVTAARLVRKASRRRNLASVRKKDRAAKRRLRRKDLTAEKARRKARYAREAARISLERKKARRWNNPKYQRTLANNREWASRNRESINQRQREYRARKRAERDAARAQATPPDDAVSTKCAA